MTTNLLANGSFELDTSLNRGSWGTFASIYGWRALNGELIELQNKSLVGVGSADGNQHIELDIGNAGHSGVYQDVANEGSGSKYTLKFSYSPRLEVAGTKANDVEVWWDGQKIATISGDTQGWQDYEFSVRGGNEGNTSRLMFKSAGDNTGYGGLIDNVSLVVDTLVKTGDANSNVINGDVGDDILDGGYGSDEMKGDDGDDILYGDTSHTGTEYMPLDLKHGDGYARAYTMQDNRFGEIVNFQGSYTQADASYADAGHFVTGTNFSFASWVKFKHSHNNNWERIFDFGNGAGDNNILLAREGTSNNIAFHVYSDNHDREIAINAQNVIITNQWLHVAVTMSEDARGQVTAKLYINGQEQASTSGHYDIATMARDNNYIAKSHWSQDGVSNIQMAGITIADRGYTANEVNTIKTNTDNPNNQNAVKITRDIQSDANPNQHGSDIIDGGAGDDNIFGNGGDDIIRGNTGKDYIDAGDGDDHIVVVGTVKAGEYSDITTTSVDKILPDSDTRDALDLLSLYDIQGTTSDRTTTDITAGETIIGGAGTDTLHIYGSVDLRHVDFSEIEAIVLNSDLTVDIEDLAKDSSIVGNSKGKAFSTLKLDTELDGKQFFDLSHFYQVKNISMISFLDEDIVLQINSKKELDALDIKSIIGKGTVQITNSAIDFAASNVVLGTNVDIIDASGVEITDKTLNLKADQRRTDDEITNANFNYYKPVAEDETYSFSPIDEDQKITISYTELTLNDTDRDGDRNLTIVKDSIKVVPDDITNIKYGTVNVNHNNKQFDFIPTADYSGTVKVKYKTQDSGGKVSDNYGELTINIKAINDAPTITPITGDDMNEDTVKNDLTVKTFFDTASDVDTPTSSLKISNIRLDTASDSDDNADLKISDSAGDGDSKLSMNDVITITPKANYSGNIIVLYDISDGDKTTTGTYDLTVKNVNDAPTITPITGDDMNEDNVKNDLTVRTFFDTASDVDGDTLKISNIRLDTASHSDDNADLKISDSAGDGDSKLSLNDVITITPHADYFGDLIIKYDISDGTVTKTGEYKLTVKNVQDAPKAKSGIVAVDYEDEDTPFTISYNTLRSFFTDADGDNLNITNIKIATASDGDATVTSANEIITVNPTLNYHGAVTFTYDIDDGHKNKISSNFKVVFDAKNDNPVANDDTIFGIGSDTYTINFASKLLNNDTDVDGDSLSVYSIKVDDSSKGTLDNIDYANGTADFKFASGITEATLKYAISDGNGGSDTADVTLDANYPSLISLSSLNGSNGFRLNATESDGRLGRSVASAGDVNGDGIDDIVVGAYYEINNRAGKAYIVFGKAFGYAASTDLSSLDGSNGFRLDGIDAGDRTGYSVSSAGDINGDGYDDIIVGAPRGDPDSKNNAGESYIVFGKASGFSPSMDLSSLDGSNGFLLEGNIAGNDSGFSVSSAGDINNDGYDDVIIGSNVGGNKGHNYIVFGKQDWSSDAIFKLSSLNGSNGFQVNGENNGDWAGYSVSNAGDVNGDGFDDMIIGAPGADILGTSNVGKTYVIFGKQDWSSDSLFDLTSLDGSNGFRLDGGDSYGNSQQSGYSVSSAGDINGDGYDDLLIGAPDASNRMSSRAGGRVYLLYGKKDNFDASSDISSLSQIYSQDFFSGYTSVDFGESVSSAGDFNGDGFDDIIIGDSSDTLGINGAYGRSYIMFGSSAGIGSSGLNGRNGIYINGIDRLDRSGGSVSSAGDINNDGYDDVIIGAWGAENGDGESYIIFGYDTNNSQSITNSGTSGNDIINGGALNDTLSGGAGDDVIHGGRGNDIINGGANDDTLHGGYGNDEFIFDNRSSSTGKDIILDFEDGKDKIVLTNYTKTGGGNFDASNLPNITQQGGDVKIVLNAGDEILIRNIDVAKIDSNDFIF